MKKAMYLFLLVFMTFSSESLCVETISLGVKFDIYNGYITAADAIDVSQVIEESWKLQESDFRGEDYYAVVATLDLEFSEADPPLRKFFGEAALIISKEGLISMGYEGGDADWVARTTFQLPHSGHKIYPFPKRPH